MNADDENSGLSAALSPFRAMAIFDDCELSSPESRGMDGDTPLHVAVLLGRTDLLLDLLPYVRNIDVFGDLNNTPLHYAALKGNAEAVKILVKNGADLNQENDYGDTPLSMMRRSDELADLLGSISNQERGSEDGF